MKFSIIIGFRKSNDQRLINLNALLYYWSNVCGGDFEVIVVEQDDNPKLFPPFPKHIEYKFILNGGEYNRSWGLNVGARMSLGEILVFCDSDILISDEDLRYCVNLMRDNGIDTIDPKGNLWETPIKEYDEKILERHEKKRVHLNFSGGIILINRNAFMRIGGWDERFVGWGGEDNAMTLKILNCPGLVATKCEGMDTYHLSHPIDGGRKGSRMYRMNLHLVEDIEHRIEINQDSFYAECVVAAKDIGRSDRYANS